MTFNDLSKKEIQDINGGGPVAAGVGIIVGAFVGCVVAGVRAVTKDDKSTQSLTMSIGTFATAGAALGLVLPCP